jgi:DNA-binding NarL/FixJ family response regulator
MIDTVVDQDLPALAAQVPAAPSSLDGLLLSENPGEGMISPEDWVSIARQLHLSPREFSVAVLIFEGNSRYQIAKRMGCAAGTIRTYIDRLFAKLNVADRLGLALRILRVHLAIVALRPQPAVSHKNATCTPK